MNEENNFNGNVENINTQPNLTTVTPIQPVAPVAPEEPVIPQAPVAPETPVAPAAPTAPTGLGQVTIQQPANKNNKKLFIIIGAGIAVLVVIILLIVLLSGSGGSLADGKHTNNTGGDYKAKDVSLNCSYSFSDEKYKLNLYVDYLFDYNKYKMYEFGKAEYIYNNLTDEEYEKFTNDEGGLTCMVDDECKKDHIEVGVGNHGLGTVIDRKGNTITLTYYKPTGIGQKATKSDVESMKKQLENDGMNCK